MTNSIASGIAFARVEGLRWPEAIEWVTQTRTTTGYGNYSATTDTGRLISSWFMETNFWLTLLLAAIVVAWFFPAAWTDDESEHIEAINIANDMKLDLLLAEQGFTQDEINQIDVEAAEAAARIGDEN